MIVLQVGTVIEYLQDNRHIGWIVDVQTSRIRVVNLHQREVKLNINRILPWVGPIYSAATFKQEILEILHRHENFRLSLLEEINPLEIWEMAQGEMETASIEWFAGLFWNKAEADQISALGRKLLDTKTHFKFVSPFFEIYAQEKVAKLLEDQRKNEERERLAAYGQTLVRALWEKHKNGKNLEIVLPNDIQQKMQDLFLAVIADCDDGEHNPLWKKIVASLPPNQNLALLLAQAWGIVPPHYNFWLSRAGYEWGEEWAVQFTAQIQIIQKQVLQYDLPFCDLPFVSIDDSSTQDIDDAFFLERNDNGFILTLALACPSFCWDFDSELDIAVSHRGTSLYLPEGKANMLPSSLGTDFFSLRQGCRRPACLLQICFDMDGKICDFKPILCSVQVKENTTYAVVENNLACDSPNPLYVVILELTKKLRAARLAAGAVITEQPQPTIVLTGEGNEIEVQLQQSANYPLSQLIVSECMILANTLAAKWALEHQIPLIFRTQNITLPAESAGIWTQPADIYHLMKNMGPSILQIDAKKHATLAVEAYAPITSSLRRYADFLNMAQIIHFCQKGEVLWHKDELQRRLVNLNINLDSVNRIQRFRPRYWKYLFFLQQAKKRYFEAIVVDIDVRIVTVSLFQEQVFLRASRSFFGEKLFCGQKFQIRLGKIDPLVGEMSILEALEL